MKLSGSGIDKGIYFIAAEPDVCVGRLPFPVPSIATARVGKRGPWRYDDERVGQLWPKANHVVLVGAAPVKHHDQRRMVRYLCRLMHEIGQFVSRGPRRGLDRSRE